MSTTATTMHDPEKQKRISQSSVKDAGSWGMAATCVTTDGFVPSRALDDSTRNRGTGDSSERNHRRGDPRPPPGIAYVAHHHERCRKQCDIRSRKESVDDRDGDEGPFGRGERPGVCHYRAHESHRGGHVDPPEFITEEPGRDPSKT